MKNKKTTSEEIDIKSELRLVSADFEKSVNTFQAHIAKVSPNKIDIDSFKLNVVKGQTLKQYEDNQIIINQISPRSVKIEPIKKEDHKILEAIRKVMSQSRFIVSDNNGGLEITMPQMSGEERQKIVKDIKVQKEKAKQIINEHRHSFIKKIKPTSENEQKLAQKEIDKIKDDYFKKIEDIFKVKEKEVIIGI